MRTDQEILDKIRDLKTRYIGLKNKESLELCKFLSKEKLSDICIHKNTSFHFVINDYVIAEMKKRKPVSKNDFIVSFRYHNITNDFIQHKISKTLDRLWKKCQGFFSWDMLEDFELLYVYVWMTKCDELSEFILKNLHCPVDCLTMCSEIFNHNYSKFQKRQQTIVNFSQDLRNLQIVFKKTTSN